MEAKNIGLAALAVMALGGVAFAIPLFGAGNGQYQGELSDERQQFHDAVISGDFATAQALHEEYGFGGRMFEYMDEAELADFAQNQAERLSARNAFQEAVSSGDYETAKQLHEEFGFGGQMFDKLDETTFGKFSQMRNAMGEAKRMRNELSEQLGIDAGQGFGKGRGRMGGMRGGFGPGNGECPYAQAEASE